MPMAGGPPNGMPVRPQGMGGYPSMPPQSIPYRPPAGQANSSLQCFPPTIWEFIVDGKNTLVFPVSEAASPVLAWIVFPPHLSLSYLIRYWNTIKQSGNILHQAMLGFFILDNQPSEVSVEANFGCRHGPSRAWSASALQAPEYAAPSICFLCPSLITTNSPPDKVQAGILALKPSLQPTRDSEEKPCFRDICLFDKELKRERPVTECLAVLYLHRVTLL